MTDRTADRIAVAGAAVSAAVFQPLRRRVQALVDRRFHRSAKDAERAVAVHLERIRDEVDLDRLVAEATGAMAAAVQPRSGTVWLRRAAQ